MAMPTTMLRDTVIRSLIQNHVDDATSSTSDSFWSSATTTTGTDSATTTSGWVTYTGSDQFYHAQHNEAGVTVREVPMIEVYSDARLAWGHKVEAAHTRRVARTERRRARQAEQQRRAQIKRKYRLEKAEEKALDMVQDVIGPEQLEVYKKTGRVLVKGARFDWLISKRGQVMSVKKIVQDKVHDLCVHLIGTHDLPANDKVAGFLLHAKYNEDYLSKKANFVGSQPLDKVQDQLKEAANF
jgi:hypothetical protein